MNFGNLLIQNPIDLSSRQCTYPVLVYSFVHIWSQHGTHQLTKEALLSGWLDFKRTQCIAPEVVNLYVGNMGECYSSNEVKTMSALLIVLLHCSCVFLVLCVQEWDIGTFIALCIL